MANRVLLGHFPDGGYGLRISKPGYDVFSNPVNQDNLYFNSDWPLLFPVYVRGSFTATNGGTNEVTFPTLGYIPYIVAASSSDGTNWIDVGAAPQVPLGGGALSNYGTNPTLRIYTKSDRLKVDNNTGVSQTIAYTVLTTRAQ